MIGRFFYSFRSNRKFFELYTENLIHNTPKEIKEKSSSLYNVGKRPLYQMMEIENGTKCLENFVQKANTGEDIMWVFQDLIAYNDFSMPEDESLKPARDELIQELKRLFEEINTVTGDQTSAFRSNRNDYYLDFNNRIYVKINAAQLKEFKFLKDGSDGIGPDTKSMLTFDLLLPFNNPHHEDTNCVAAKDLPIFYRRKVSRAKASDPKS